jgi:branched-chain amino acid transport system substrate-binding protein
MKNHIFSKLGAARGGISWGLSLLFATTSLAVGTASAEDGPIKIGFVTELSGAWSYFGGQCEQGMKLAVSQINESGGVLNRPLEFLVADNRTSGADALAAVRRLDTQDNVVAILGPTNSDAALAIYGYAEENRIPFLPSVAHPQLTKPGTKYSFRFYPADSVGLGASIAKFVASEKPAARVAIMYSDFAGLRALFAGFKYEAEIQKLEIVSEIAFPPGSNDATVQAAQVVAANPDYVVVQGGGAFDNTITTKLLDFGVEAGKIVHPFGLTSAIFGWGERSIGSVYASAFDINQSDVTPEGKAFYELAREQVGREPSWNEVLCSVAVHIAKAAIEDAGSTDREKIRDSLSALKTVDPTTGIAIEFNENGARKESYSVFMKLDAVDQSSYKASPISRLSWESDEIPAHEIAQ